jgi:DNA polymerase III delta subunit
MPKTMIIYLYGQDSYRRQQKLKELIAKYKEKHSGLTVENFDLENDGELIQLKDFVSAQSLFGGSKLGIIRCHSANKELIPILKSATDDKTVNLFLVADKHLGKDFNFLLKKPFLSEEFEPLIGAQFAAFIKKESAKRNLQVSPGVLNNLIRLAGSDSWLAVNELEKLALGAKLEDGVLYPNFFVLLNRLRSDSLASRLSALNFLLENEDAAAVFNVLVSQLDGEMKIKMADYDVAIKSGKLEYEEALTDLII